jgi:tetraacyldisaccharide 4'-kinase
VSKANKYRLFLFPLSIIYGFVVWFRNKLFDFKIIKQHEFDIPVISDGNISVGGTGKTPHSEYIISLFQKDFNIALLSRGYGRKTKGFLIADENSTSKTIGDEPMQIKKKFQNITVAVDEKRVRGINKLTENSDLNLVILDDAYQHRSVKPGMNILLIDYYNLISEDHILPAGNLRESETEKYRAHIIFITKSPKNIKPIDRRIIEKDLVLYPYQSLYFTTLNYGNLINIFNKNTIELNNKTHYLILTGIANPKPLYKYISDIADNTTKIKFSDHHKWSSHDFEKIKTAYKNISEINKIIITTEKDYIRLIDSEFIELIKELPIYYIPIEVDFLDQEQKKVFNKQIVNYVKKNKRSYRLYQK